MNEKKASQASAAVGARMAVILAQGHVYTIDHTIELIGHRADPLAVLMKAFVDVQRPSVSTTSALIELGEGIREMELRGNYFGQFSLTVVIHDQNLSDVNRACAEFYKVFSVHDAQLYEERYNLLNAYLACVPGNAAFNLRRILDCVCLVAARP